MNLVRRFVSCLKLRYRNPEDMLNALVTTQNVYFMKVGLPTSEHVVLNIKLVDLYKARYKVEGMWSADCCLHDVLEFFLDGGDSKVAKETLIFHALSFRWRA